MQEGKELIQKGLDYCKHVEGYKTSKLLSQAILINMAGMGGECLLGGLTRLYEHEATHGNISSHLGVLQYIMPVPVEVAKAARYIEKTTAMCSLGLTDNTPVEMDTLVAHLIEIKQWVLEMCSCNASF
ncbi:hypothetical protein J1N10_14135 [Carboxylicivirga sp. A043]|uniref:hypothetical protein n=1 Tax=Carboxylicivirga litoralis TaxID=2816963 RepID=UPI0021CB1073|nr:hypothetical protein [Carboxylicivirga sp. A043]MCU4157122.1 hypothetical protein [Carboxylicivirga sp. A043]